MQYTVHFVQEVSAQDLEPPMMLAALETLKSEQAVAGSLTLVVTDEDRIRELNQNFAGIDQPTDVLAFPGEEIDPDEQGNYFGDVIIALPFAKRQAQKAGHSIQAEVSLLVVHGILHLLGYDHASKDDKQAMWAKQTAILAELGLNSLEVSE